MAANLKFTLKRNNGTDYDELYPKTVVAQVSGLQTALDAKVDESREGQANGIATLGSDGKIPTSQLPSAVTGGMRFAGTLNLSTSKSIDTVILTANEEGEYLIVTNTGQVTQGSTATGTIASPGDEGLTDFPITLEAGDWLVVTEVSGSNYTFAVINNTYRDATSGVNGIVTLSDGNSGIITGLAGNTVITEGVLSGLLLGGDQNGAVTTKIATSGHTHSQYQPLDADLTAIAALSNADGNIIVGNGTAWVVESGSTARSSLGLAIGTNVQAYDAGLQSIAGLTTAANKMIYTTGSDAYAVADLTSFARSILDDADAEAVRTTIGAQVAGSYQTYSANLDAIAGLATTDGNIIVGSGLGGWVAESGATARASLGLTIGTHIQAYDADLSAIAALAKTDGNFIVGNGTTWVAESGATARDSLDVYSKSSVDGFFTNRPEIYYNTTLGTDSGDLILADVTAV